MPPRTKLCKNRAPGTGECVEKNKISGWERSKIFLQDKRLLKKLGLFKKEAMRMPGDESSPHPPSGFRGWRKKWLYVKDESSANQEYDLAPFDSSEDIQRHKSWDREATAEEKAATDVLIARIQELQNTEGEELSGVQIIAHFLRIRVQPLQARKNPLWMYSGAEDADRVSDDLPLEDLEKLVHRFTSLSKNNEVPSSCRVWNHSVTHHTLSSLPPLPEGVSKRVVLTDDSQETSAPESEPVESEKSMGSSDKDSESVQPSDSAHSTCPPPAASLDKRKRKRNVDEEHSGASKLSVPAAEESSPEEQEIFDPYTTTGAPLMKEMVDLGSRFIGFRDEAKSLREALRHAKERADDLEEKLKASEEAREKAEKDAAGVEDLRRRLQAAEDALSDREAKLVQRDNDIISRLETQSRRFLRKMGEHYTRNQELDEDRVLDTLTILELNYNLERGSLLSARNAFRHIFPHFFSKTMQFKIFAQLVQLFLAKDDPALAHRQASLKIGVERTISLVAASGQKVDWAKAATVKGLNNERWKALVKDAKLYSKKLIAFLDPRSSASASTAQMELIFYNYTGAGYSDTSPAASHSTKVPGSASLDSSSCTGSIEKEVADLRRKLQSMKKQTMTALEQSRKSSDREQTALRQAQESLELKETTITNAARSARRESYMLDLMTDASQDMAGAFLYTAADEQSLDLYKVFESFLLNMSKRRVNIDKHNAAVSPFVEIMIDELLKVDTTFFKEYRYDDST
nr:uncharacterized protein LOC127303752 [Lolium perenne]